MNPVEPSKAMGLILVGRTSAWWSTPHVRSFASQLNDVGFVQSLGFGSTWNSQVPYAFPYALQCRFPAAHDPTSSVLGGPS
jgi:hypothetical protein